MRKRIAFDEGILGWGIRIAAVFLMFLTSRIPAFGGLSNAGMQVLGIMAGAVLLWVTHGIGWTNFLVILAIMTVPGVGPASAISATFGNSMAVFVLLCMMLFTSLTRTGLAGRIAWWFITNRLGRKGPWWMIAMYFAAMFVLSVLLSAVSAFVILIPCLTEILGQAGIRREDRREVSRMMLFGTVVIGQLGDACSPISPISIAGMSLFSGYTGGTIELFTYGALMMPIGIALSVVWFMYCRLLWKPDVSAFLTIDYEGLGRRLEPLSRRARAAALIDLLVIVLWMLPGIARGFFPALYPIVSSLHNCYPPLIGLILLQLVTVDGEPVFPFSETFGGARWDIYVFIATVMGLGSLVSNEEIGIRAFLGSVFAPLFDGVAPILFLVLMVFFTIMLTNCVSNAVCVAVSLAIALPLCLSVFEGRIHPMGITLLVTGASQFAWTLPFSTPSVIIALGTGWIDSGTMVRKGIVAALLLGTFYCLIGIPFLGAVTG